MAGTTGMQRRIQRWAASASITRLVAPLVDPADRFLLNMTGDRYSLTTLFTGMPVRLLTTTGAISAANRTHPLTTLEDGARLALIASNFGRRRFPSWYHNLRAHPLVWVRFAGRQRRFLARPASAEEQGRYWAMAVELYPGYAAYGRWAAPRQVPVVVLEPIGDGADA